MQHAAPRDETSEPVELDELPGRFASYFAEGGVLVDQPFVPGVVDGLVRAYLVGGAVVGFATQQPDPAVRHAPGAADRIILGVPSAKTMHPASEPAFAALRDRLETDWVSGMCELTEIAPSELPVLWDADFIRRSAAGATVDYVLCEINVSSVLPFPPGAPPAVVAAVRAR